MGKMIMVCPTCGRKIVEYKHAFNIVLLKGLTCLENAGGRASLREISDKMSKSVYNNFQKLRHFGLVEKDPKNKSVYVITERGKNFLAGKGGCPAYVKTSMNAVVWEGPEINVSDILPAVQNKEDWQEQASII